MKNSISRQYLYLMGLSLLLLIFVFVFSFGVLIPKGQEYRQERVKLIKIKRELREYEDFMSQTQEKLQNLKSTNRRVISAFDATFNPDRFEKQNKKFFSSLRVSAVDFVKKDTDFVAYEVNTTSKISSPASFYDFLDSVNKSDWIIGVNFPINFKREGDFIKSSFTMHVYCNNNETNASASESSKR